jgi:putative toxin-antitoxin system antitoxin component (TIGR02293 family)
MPMTMNQAVMSILGLPAAPEEAPMTQLDFVRMVREGISHAMVVQALANLGLSQESTSRAVGIAPRSLARRKGGRLGAHETERFLRLVRVSALAEEVLGGRDKARRWLTCPNRALGGESPMALLDTDIGERLVEDTLGRLAHGVHS